MAREDLSQFQFLMRYLNTCSVNVHGFKKAIMVKQEYAPKQDYKEDRP
jgi:hypothetical protein